MAKRTRFIWLKLHLYLGILAGIPLFVIGLTGGVLAFRPELQQWTLSDLYHVEVQGERLSPAEAAKRHSPSLPESHASSYHGLQG